MTDFTIPEVLLAVFIYDVFKEGILKKIQVLIASKLVKSSNSKLQELKRYAAESCSQIDDLLINPVAGVGDRLNRIINGDDLDLSPLDRQLYQQSLDESYRVSVLSEKLGVENDFS